MKLLTQLDKRLLVMNKKNVLTGVWITLCLLFFTACHKEQSQLDNPSSVVGEQEVQLTIKVPSSFSSALTRGLTGAQEKEIVAEDIIVLVFDKDGGFLDKKHVTGITTPDATTTNFIVKLTPSAGVDDKYKIVVLANAKGIVDSQVLTGKSYTDISALFKATITQKMFETQGTGIPMWGETEPIQVTVGAAIPAIKLYRSVARIDVGVGTLVGSDNANFTWNAGSIPFKLTEVIVALPNKQYAVVPTSTFNTASAKVATPSVPAGTTKFTLAESIANFKYAVGNETFITRDIYVPESDIIQGDAAGIDPTKNANRMAILVGGKYNGSATVTYYRLDFKSTTKQLINALRNHLYLFNITSVTGSGSATPGEAYNAASFNMSSTVEEWELVQINNEL